MKLSLDRLKRRRSAIAGSVQRLDNAGLHERAERLAGAFNRIDAAIAECRRLLAAERHALVAAELDRLDELSDEEIRVAGGVVVHCDGLRIVGFESGQALRQYGRVNRALLENGIPNERAEWATRDVWLELAFSGRTAA